MYGGDVVLYTPLVIKAIKYAYNAHHGQYDVSGVPYIFHPYHLAEQFSGETEVCAAAFCMMLLKIRILHLKSFVKSFHMK